MVDSCMGDKRNTQDIVWETKEIIVTEERYYVLFMVNSCMGDKRNTQDINCD